MISTAGAGQQSDCTPNPPRRRDFSWRYATDSDLAAILYTIPLGRWKTIRDLKSRALRVLRFFAALNRTGTAGYRGTRCSMGALAAAVRRATEEAGSKRTVQRALKELVEAGYLTYTTANGRFRQIGPDNWIAEQICIYTLTDKALAIWTYTSIPMTNCRGDDQKNPENKSQSFARARSGLHVGKKTETVLSKRFKPTDLEQSDQLIPPTTLENVRRGKKAEQGGRTPASTERKKSTLPRDASIAILECLKSVLLKRGRQGKVALARAALELSEGGVVGDVGTGVHWEYWRNRWFTLSRDEQFHAIRADILPMLLKPANGPPSANRWPDRSRATKPPAAAISERAPTPADTVRHLRELGKRCLGGELAASIARILSIEHFDEKRSDSG